MPNNCTQKNRRPTVPGGRLVKSIARKYSSPTLDEDDLFQIGYVAYLEAKQKHTAGDFDAYARQWIVGAILRALCDEAGASDYATSPDAGLDVEAPDADPSAQEAWPHDLLSLLTGDERRLAERFALGDSEREAAVALGLSHKRVRTLKQSIAERLTQELVP